MKSDRREFLEKFVVLGSATLIFSGCGGGGTTGAVYGPPPVDNSTMIFFKDNQGDLIVLDSAIDLPLDLLIIIEFPTEMNIDIEQNIHLIDEFENIVSLKLNWKTECILEIKATEDEIKYDKFYTLKVDTDTVDKEGSLIDLPEYLFSATFRTKVAD